MSLDYKRLNQISFLGLSLSFAAAVMNFWFWLQNNEIMNHPVVFGFYRDPLRQLVNQPVETLSVPVKKGIALSSLLDHKNATKPILTHSHATFCLSVLGLYYCSKQHQN